MAPKLTPNEKRKEFVKMLRELREKGWTIDTLARDLSCSRASIWRWTTYENEYPSSTRIDQLYKEAKALSR